MLRQKSGKVKKNGNRSVMSVFYIVVLTAYVGITCFSLLYHYNQAISLRETKERLQIELEKENRNNIVYDNRLKYYYTDSYVENAARERLNLVKPDEIIFIDRNK